MYERCKVLLKKLTFFRWFVFVTWKVSLTFRETFRRIDTGNFTQKFKINSSDIQSNMNVGRIFIYLFIFFTSTKDINTFASRFRSFSRPFSYPWKKKQSFPHLKSEWIKNIVDRNLFIKRCKITLETVYKVSIVLWI